MDTGCRPDLTSPNQATAIFRVAVWDVESLSQPTFNPPSRRKTAPVQESTRGCSKHLKTYSKDVHSFYLELAWSLLIPVHVIPRFTWFTFNGWNGLGPANSPRDSPGDHEDGVQTQVKVGTLTLGWSLDDFLGRQPVENHRKTIGKWWFDGIWWGCYPLVMT